MKNTVSVLPRYRADALVENPTQAVQDELDGDSTSPWGMISICGNHEQSPILLTDQNTEILRTIGCVDGLTSIFVDITRPAYLLNKEWYDSKDTWFTEKKAKEILAFVDLNKNRVDKFIVHCDAGLSRSAAVGLWLVRYLGWDESIFVKTHRHRHLGPNPDVLETLMEVSGLRSDYQEFWDKMPKYHGYRMKPETEKDVEDVE